MNESSEQIAKLNDLPFWAFPQALWDTNLITQKEIVALLMVFGHLRQNKGWKECAELGIDYICNGASISRVTLWRLKQKLGAAGIFTFQHRGKNTLVWQYHGIPADWKDRWQRRANRLEARSGRHEGLNVSGAKQG